MCDSFNAMSSFPSNDPLFSLSLPRQGGESNTSRLCQIHKQAQDNKPACTEARSRINYKMPFCWPGRKLCVSAAMWSVHWCISASWKHKFEIWLWIKTQRQHCQNYHDPHCDNPQPSQYVPCCQVRLPHCEEQPLIKISITDNTENKTNLTFWQVFR